MSTLYIRLPSRATRDSALAEALPPCLFAQVSAKGQIARHGCESLSGLAALIADAERVVLLLAAADVTLLCMQVPPLSAAKLKAALPHLVEDHLLAAPADCVIVAGSRKNDSNDQLKQIAVVQRDWLELLVNTLSALGARNLQVLPAQLCLPWREDVAVAAIAEHGMDVDVALRLSTQHGIGWSACPVSAQSAPQEIVEGLRVTVPQQPITLYVPAASHDAYAAYCARDASDVTVQVDDWSHWVNGAQDLSRSGAIDLMAGLNLGTAGVNWRGWRWPLALATAVLLVNIVSLNLDWWNMRREANLLRTGMLHSYRAAFPTETVIIDPIAQTKQKIALAERAGGQLAADDFVALVARFGAAWASVPQMPTSEKGAIAGLEYRDRHLLVRLNNPADADAYRSQIKAALEANQLTLTASETGVWQIGSRK